MCVIARIDSCSRSAKDSTLTKPAGTYTPLHAFREAYTKAKAKAIGVNLSDSSESDSSDDIRMPSPLTASVSDKAAIQFMCSQHRPYILPCMCYL